MSAPILLVVLLGVVLGARPSLPPSSSRSPEPGPRSLACPTLWRCGLRAKQPCPRSSMSPCCPSSCYRGSCCRCPSPRAGSEPSLASIRSGTSCQARVISSSEVISPAQLSSHGLSPLAGWSWHISGAPTSLGSVAEESCGQPLQGERSATAAGRVRGRVSVFDHADHSARRAGRREPALEQVEPPGAKRSTVTEAPPKAEVIGL